jgi:hypothetical protein
MLDSTPQQFRLIPNLHLKAMRRHIRLANKQKGAEKFATRIIPYQTALIEKHQNSQLADENREDA